MTMAMLDSEAYIDIVIPNWNGKQFLGTCLESLRRQTYQKFRVIVVDNGSIDGSCAYLDANFPEVKVIALRENTGFSVAVNAGIEASQAPWILLLNNDMEVDGACLQNLVNGCQRYPEIDAFALKMVNFKQRHLLDGAGDAVLRGGVGYRLGTMEEDGPSYQQDRPVFGACAGAALYRREFFQQVGLFDSDFFAYLEDVDLNLRARRLGKSYMYLAAAKVFHIGSASSGSKFNPLTIRLSTRNNLLVIAKNYSWTLFARFLPAILVYQIAWLLFCGKKRMLGPYFQGLAQGVGSFCSFTTKRRILSEKPQIISENTFAILINASECEAIRSIMARRSANGKGNAMLTLYCRLFL